MMINQDVELLPIEEDEKSDVYNFLFKLKIRKDEVRDQTLGFEIKEDETKNTRVCPICEKGFRSGKALGGHMRIHKAVVKMEEAKFKPRKKWNGSSPTCMVCSKEFPSDKSLFGHMRSHPERQWRGVCPPPSWSIASTREPVDLTQSLMGWTVTAKRGRKAVLKQEEDERLNDCVYYLMMLAHGNNVLQSDDENLDEPMVIEKKRKRKRVLKLKRSDDDQTVVDNSKYKCSTCDKSFSTHQALGGHRSSAHKSNEIVLSSETSLTPCCKMLDFVLDLNQEPRES